jgi:GT2 family glycosyltransferase
VTLQLIAARQDADSAAIMASELAGTQVRMTNSDAARQARDPGEGGTVFAVIPVFNRWRFTRQCIDDLRRQTYPRLSIIVSDGGSRDDTRAALAEFDDVTLVYDKVRRWWAGSTALGINVALRQGLDGDFVLLLNNDTRIPSDYVAALVRCALTHNAAVGGLIADGRDPAVVLDAGVTIDWQTYQFPARTQVAPDETFFDRVDTLSGRGSLVPLPMVRAVGNVDDRTFPHYIADYDFFCRIKAAGFRLGVCPKARLLAHVEETGIAPTAAIRPVREVVRTVISRRSMSNFRDHRRFIMRHAPAQHRERLLRALSISTFGSLIYHTRLSKAASIYKRLAERHPALRRLTRWMR